MYFEDYVSIFLNIMLGPFYVMVYMVCVYEVQIQINAEQPLSLRLTSSFGIV
jgi:hypothetical protein